MKKAMKIIGIILLAIIAPLAIMFIKAALTPAVPKNYTKIVETGGSIEAKYLKNGSFKTAYTEAEADERLGKYEIYYPDELADDLGWHYDITKVHIPILMAAGTEKFDAETVIPLEKMNEM